VPVLQHRDGDGLAAVRVGPGGGQQLQRSGWRAGVAGADAGLLGGDHGGGGLADGQAPAEPVRLGVVVDQDRRAVVVAVQAIQRQAEDVLRATTGVDGDLDGGPDLRRFQGIQAGAQLVHDLSREIASRLAARGVGGNVACTDGEVAGQPGGRLPGAGQSQGADPGEHEPRAAADDVAVVAADRPGGLKVAEPVQERVDVGPPERLRFLAVVITAAQAL
jgi:hypothetical protein